MTIYEHENLHFDNELDIHVSWEGRVATPTIWIC